MMLGALSVSTAQNDDNEDVLEAGCPTMVQRALLELGNTCSGIERNNACYGSGDVQATFTLDAQNPDFDLPGDEAQLTFIETLRTAPLIELPEDESDWGIAVLNVIANLPDVLPGQAVTFLLMGDAELENAVTPADARLPVEPISVMTIVDANIRNRPELSGSVIGGVESNTELSVDGTDSTGEWLRLLWEENSLAWISRTVIVEDSTLDNLPIIASTTSVSPMQAFYLRTGVGRQNCAEAPNALVVQGRDQFTVNLNINGADVQFGDTVVIQAVPEDETETSTKLPTNQRAMQSDQDDLASTSRLRIIALGEEPVIINAGEADEVIISNGQETSTCLSAPQNLGIDGQANDQVIIIECGWTAPQEISFEDAQAFDVLQDVPPAVIGGQTLPAPRILPANPQMDTDGDGVVDGEDNCPFRPNPGQRDTDNDGRGNACDRDDDNDGVLDINDFCPLEAGGIQGCAGNPNGDIDEDGIPNGIDNCPYDANPDQRDPDNDSIGFVCDDDNDNDGIPDIDDQCPLTPTNTASAQCTPENQDSDNDGIVNLEDNCPDTRNVGQTDHDGDGIGSACDPDIDGDGRLNGDDECPLEAGIINGCPAEEQDSDNDGVPDSVDNCPINANQAQNDYDNDGIGNSCDQDNDNDGVPDEDDNCPTVVNPNQADLDADEVGDMCDDSDADGVRDANDACPFDGDRGNGIDATGCPNPVLIDSDNDGIPDNSDNCPSVGNAGQGDLDNDGIGNACDNDIDNDGFPNVTDQCPQTPGTFNGCPDGDDDNDGVPNSVDVCPGGNDNQDLDNDGTPNACDQDVDGDGTPNNIDLDNDNDGIRDEDDACPLDPSGNANGCP